MNQMPQATALYINPSDFIPKGDGHALRKRLMSAKREPVKREEGKVELRLVEKPKAPVAPLRQHDSHVAAYYEWKANGPLGWLKMRCRDMGVSYIDIVGRSRHRELIDPRHRLMAEMKAEFPHMTLPHIGRMFDRDHTVVYFAIRKMDIGDKPKKPPIGFRMEEVRAMYLAENSMRSIGRELGYDYKTVATYIKRMGWTR